MTLALDFGPDRDRVDRPDRRGSAQVDFELSDDQVALRDAAEAMLDDLAAPARVRAHLDAGTLHDEKLWTALTEQGWLAVELPEADGGLGLGFVEAMVLAEQVGRHVAPVPFH